MILKITAMAAALALCGPAFAQGTTSSAPANDYLNPASWLCRPGHETVCTTDQRATVVSADGSTTIKQWKAAEKPEVDCFYVYPTVSFDRSANSDMIPGREESGVAEQQLNRFGSQCRIFAPLYRQVTITALRSIMLGTPMSGIDRELAYRDVRDAWRTYLQHDNAGRGVVFIGHSQGSTVLKRLLAEEIDGKPVQKQLVSAILPGTNLLVPSGKVVGGDLKSIPLCTRIGQAGCVISYVTFRNDAPPPANSRFGRTQVKGMKVACVNPAAIVGGSGLADAYFATGTSALSEQRQIAWARGATITTPFVQVPGLISAECVDADGAQYLALTVHPGPNHARTDQIPGDVIAGGKVSADWGLHLVDVHANMGGLVTALAAQRRKFAAAEAKISLSQ
jgi:hypothetical protein